ncbi:hypothetical protein BJ742DRAFT_325748 [Cladochytrium replicatum]|nr:hypothetical protein BJ742DRAFT_325748 [Cladochytrium replicatum]
MSEYWVSGKKYYCRYCKIYVTDNKPSRQHHENGKKHRDLEQAFLREVTRRQGDKERESKEAQKLLAQIDRAAHEQYATDVASGAARSHSVSSGTSASTSVKRKSAGPAYGYGGNAGKPPPAPSSQLLPQSLLQSITYPDPSPAEQPPHDPSDPFGPWVAVEVPAQSTTTTSTKEEGNTDEVDDDLDDYGPHERVSGFVLKEKVAAVMDDDGSAEKPNSVGTLFKKRKKKDNTEGIKKPKVEGDT